MHVSQKGFTLIELMIVMVVVSILAAFAVPQYQQYVNKAKFTEVISAVAPHKLSVALCVMDVGMDSLNSCDSGENGIPAASTQVVGNVGSIVVADGKIIATAASVLGNSTESSETGDNRKNPTYELTPKFVETSLVWEKGGTCVGAKLC